MTTPVHLVCARCAAIVRSPRERLADGPKCPRCEEPLFTGHPFALSSANWEVHLTRSDLPLVVDFWAPWCAPCRAMAPHFENVAAQLEPRLRFAKINTEEEPALGARFGIRSIPTLVVFAGGREIARQSGAMPATALYEWLSGVLKSTPAYP